MSGESERSYLVSAFIRPAHGLVGLDATRASKRSDLNSVSWFSLVLVLVLDVDLPWLSNGRHCDSSLTLVPSAHNLQAAARVIVHRVMIRNAYGSNGTGRNVWGGRMVSREYKADEKTTSRTDED